MQIDTRIPLSFQSPQIEDPMEGLGKALTLKNLMAVQQAHQFQMEEAQRAAADEDNARELFRKNPNPSNAELYSVLGPKAGAALVKARNEAQEKQLDVDGKRAKRLGEIASSIEDEQGMHRGIGTALSEGVIDRDTALQLLQQPWSDQTKAQLKQIGGQALDAKAKSEMALAQLRNEREQAEEQRKKALHPIEMQQKAADATKAVTLAGQYSRYGMTDQERRQLEEQAYRDNETMLQNRRTATETERHNRRGEALTAQGQTMTDERARELAQITRDNKPPTNDQQTLATYTARMESAEQQLLGANQGNWERRYNAIAPNGMMTETGQSFDQAERNYINAILRRESGAAISDSEFVSARKQYIPQAGDSDKVLKQKAENRKLVIESFKRGAGKAYVSPNELINGPAPLPAKLGPEHLGRVFTNAQGQKVKITNVNTKDPTKYEFVVVP